MRGNRRVIIGLLALVVVVGGGLLAWCMLTSCGKGTSEAVAARRDITAYLTLEGESAAPAAADASVLPPYRAAVEKVLVTVGQNVREGEVLMQLAAPSSEVYYQQARQRVMAARAALTQAQSRYSAQLQSARRELDQARAQERSIRKSLQAGAEGAVVTVTGTELEDAVAQRQAAEQAVVDSEAIAESGVIPYQRQLADAEQYLKDAEGGVKAAAIRTPISGTVLEIYAKPGQIADPEEEKPVVRVVNLEALRVYAAADDEALPHLKPVAPAVINFGEAPGEEFTGSLKNVYSKDAGFLRGVEHVAVFDFANRKGLAKPGMDAVVKVKVGEVRDALAVPASAVYEAGEQHAVKLRSGREWRERIVEIGVSDGKYTEIKSGLKEGDVVQASG